MVIKMDQAYNFLKNELEKIRELPTQIGTNLFEKGIENYRKNDAEVIYEGLKSYTT